MHSRCSRTKRVERPQRKHGNIPLKTRRICIALAALALFGAATPAVEKFGKTRGAIVLPNGPPAGSVILIPGGTTLQHIGDDGKPGNEANFVIRIRDDFVAAGYAIAYLEDPSDLRPVIACMRTIARPVFLLGTQRDLRRGPCRGNLWRRWPRRCRLHVDGHAERT